MIPRRNVWKLGHHVPYAFILLLFCTTVYTKIQSRSSRVKIQSLSLLRFFLFLSFMYRHIHSQVTVSLFRDVYMKNALLFTPFWSAYVWKFTYVPWFVLFCLYTNSKIAFTVLWTLHLSSIRSIYSTRMHVYMTMQI